MATTVIVKNSVVAGKRPTAGAGNKVGEIWVNPVDKVIGTFDATGTPVEVGATASLYHQDGIPFASAAGVLKDDTSNLNYNPTTHVVTAGGFAFNALGTMAIRGMTTATPGTIRYSNTDNSLYYFDGAAWQQIATTSGGGDVDVGTFT